MRWRSALLTASSAALLAGCGGSHRAAPPPPPPPPPRIPADVANRLATQAERVATLAPGTCPARDAAAALRDDVIASIDQIPARYQEPLTSAANDLAARLTACTATEPPPRRHDGHEKHEKHGKHGPGHEGKDG
jgi:hypothetical protein